MMNFCCRINTALLSYQHCPAVVSTLLCCRINTALLSYQHCSVDGTTQIDVRGGMGELSVTEGRSYP